MVDNALSDMNSDEEVASRAVEHLRVCERESRDFMPPLDSQ